jgi:hypothetical protein
LATLLEPIKAPVVLEISAQNADYIAQACNAYPVLVERVADRDEEIGRLRERVALLDSLLGECLRHHYYDDARVSLSWLEEARLAVTNTTGQPGP